MTKSIDSTSMNRRAPVKSKEHGECQVSGCREEAARSMAAEKFKEVMKISFKQEARRVHVCKKHYRQFRKKTKQDRKLERLGW